MKKKIVRKGDLFRDSTKQAVKTLVDKGKSTNKKAKLKGGMLNDAL